MTRRVVVTGIGLVCAVGIGTEESWKNLLAGQGGIATITSFDTAGFDCRIAGGVKNFYPFQWIERIKEDGTHPAGPGRRGFCGEDGGLETGAV